MELGIDLVETDRIRRTIERWGDRFTLRVFTSRENRFCRERRNPHLSYAARFAAKEALLKATGTGLGRGVSWRDMEILDDEHSKPSVEVRGEVGRLIGTKRILLSLSHTTQYAVAVVIIQ